jgi:hypothetical protein
VARATIPVAVIPAAESSGRTSDTPTGFERELDEVRLRLASLMAANEADQSLSVELEAIKGELKRSASELRGRPKK